MSYVSIAEELPQEFRLPFLKFVEAFAKDLRDQLAVRREDFDGLTATVRELAEAQKRTEQQIQELVESQKRTEAEIRRLAEKQSDMSIRLDEVVGDNLARRYRDNPFAYFGPVLRRVRVIPLQEIESELESRLSEAEIDDLRFLDLLVRGQLRRQPDAPPVWLAVEVSAVVDRNDVARAKRRAMLLRKVGYTTVPAAAGKEVTQGGEDTAQDEHVLVLQDGRRWFWEEALANALSDAPPA